MNMESIGKAMVLFVLFQAITTSTCRLCHFESEISASSWVRKPCVFFFGNEIKTMKYIGSEFRFGDDAATKEAFKVLKANFNEFFDSPLTRWNYTCDCTKVPCLNEEQLNNLFAYSMEQARKEARTRFPFLSRLCCTLQQVLGEIVFRLLPDDVEKLTTIAFKEINIHNWIVNFTNGLRQIEWCKTFKERCDSIVHHIAKGCDKKRRGKRNIGLNTTAVHGSSSCFQDIGSVSSSSLMNLQETSLFHSKIMTARTWSETEKTVQALVSSSPRSRSSTRPRLPSPSPSSFTSPYPSQSCKSTYGSRAHSEELSPSPFMSSYMTPPMATQKAVSEQEGGKISITSADKPTTTAFQKTTVSRSNSTFELAVRVSKGSSLAPLSESVTRLETGNVPSTSTISTRNLEKLSAFSSKATPQISSSVTISNTDLAKQLSSRQSSKNYMIHSSSPKSSEPFVSISSSSLTSPSPSSSSSSSSSSPPQTSSSLLSSPPMSLSSSLSPSSASSSSSSSSSLSLSTTSLSPLVTPAPSSLSTSSSSSPPLSTSSMSSLSPSSILTSVTPSLLNSTTPLQLFSLFPSHSSRGLSSFVERTSTNSSSRTITTTVAVKQFSSLLSSPSSSSSSLTSSTMATTMKITLPQVFLTSFSLATTSSPSSSSSSSSSLSSSPPTSSSSSSSSLSSPSSTTTTTVIDAATKTTSSPLLLTALSSLPSTSLPSLISLQMKVNTTTETITSLSSSQSSMSFFSSMSSQLSPHRFSTPLLSTRIFSRRILSDHTMLRSYSSSNSFSTSYQLLSFTLTSSLKTSHASTPWLVSSRSSTLRDSTLILRTSLVPQSLKPSLLPSTLGAKSNSSSQKTLSNHSFSRTKIAPSRTLGTFEFSYSKSSTTWPVFTETFVVKFQGHCSMITNKDAFKLSFVITLSYLLRLSRSDVIVRDVICGSVDVIFMIKTTREINITSELREMIKNESFAIKYNGTVFTAFDIKAISKPTVFSPTSYSTPTEISNHERKKLVFIIFVLFGTIFAALFLFLLVIFCSRFGACRQKSRKLRMQKRVRSRAHDFELKRFAARRRQFLGVNYYGDIAHLDENNKKESEVEIVEEDINDYYEDEFAEGHQADTNISLLNSNNHTNANKLEEQKFVFDDEDSCSSVLFY